MTVKPVEIIVAVDEAGGFGKDGKIPWHLPEDLKHFQELTKHHICVMGRHTYQEILDMKIQHQLNNEPITPISTILIDRKSFVITSDDEYQTPGATRVKDLRSVQWMMADDTRKIFVIGGRGLFIEALAWCNTIHMTIVKGSTYGCDVFFPIQVLNKKFTIISGKETEKAYYVTYQRK